MKTCRQSPPGRMLNVHQAVERLAQHGVPFDQIERALVDEIPERSGKSLIGLRAAVKAEIERYKRSHQQ